MDLNALIYIFASVFLVSLISITGLAAISIKEARLKKIVLYLVSFAAGALFGDAFLHLLPEAFEQYGFTEFMSLTVIAGILLFFVIEKIIKWHHCHDLSGKCEVHSFTQMSLIGDGVHNIIDGMIIAGSYMASIPLGIATTIAVVLHEIPQEIGDYAILIHGGYTKQKALMMNFLTALTAFIGAILIVFFSGFVPGIQNFLLPFTAGGFIYIAGSDLLPELHKEINAKTSFFQLIALIAGIALMAALKSIA